MLLSHCRANVDTYSPAYQAYYASAMALQNSLSWSRWWVVSQSLSHVGSMLLTSGCSTSINAPIANNGSETSHFSILSKCMWND